MIPHFSPFGYMIMAVFYAVVFVLYWYLIWTTMASWKRTRLALAVPVTIVVLALPWIDEMWITWRFNELCKTEGPQVVRAVKVEGYLVDMGRSSSSKNEKVGLMENPQIKESFDRSGYRFKETMYQDGKVRHLEREPEGVRVTILDRPEARYSYTTAMPSPKFEEVAGFKIEKIEYRIVDLQTGEVIGRDTRYKRFPGWVEGLWVGFFGSGLTTCSDLRQKPLPHNLVESVLIPANE